MTDEDKNSLSPSDAKRLRAILDRNSYAAVLDVIRDHFAIDGVFGIAFTSTEYEGSFATNDKTIPHPVIRLK